MENTGTSELVLRFVASSKFWALNLRSSSFCPITLFSRPFPPRLRAHKEFSLLILYIYILHAAHQLTSNSDRDLLDLSFAHWVSQWLIQMSFSFENVQKEAHLDELQCSERDLAFVWEVHSSSIWRRFRCGLPGLQCWHWKVRSWEWKVQWV